jgi:hypothetical protein
MIYLLDLNFTLVANSDEKKSPFIRQIEAERYRFDLIKRIKDDRVFLLTARPSRYYRATLESIKAKTGWLPERAFFNSYGLPPPNAKEEMLKLILPSVHGEELFGIESNPATRAIYQRHGIKSCSVKDFLA